MRHFIISCVGEDRPGIVAAITEVLYRNGFNIEDSTMTRLNNEFAMMLIVTTDKDISDKGLEKEFRPVSEKKGLFINVKEIPQEVYTKKESSGDLYNIVVYGADKPGIVYRVSQLLAEKGINIVDLRTEKSSDFYVLIAQVEFPESLDVEELLTEIEKLKNELNIDISCEKVESVEM